jgi:hypothetical protein
MNSRRWDLVSVVLAFIALSIYWVLQKPEIIALFVILFVWLLCSAFLKDSILGQPHLSLPDVYSVNLIRILQQAARLEQQKTPEIVDAFESAIADVIRQIDADTTKLRDNLAASRTTRALGDLKTFLLKFAYVVKNPEKASLLIGRKDAALPKIMSQDIALAADDFHCFYGLERTSEILNRNIASLSEIAEEPLQSRSRSIGRIVRRGGHRLPAFISWALHLLLERRIGQLALSTLAAAVVPLFFLWVYASMFGLTLFEVVRGNAIQTLAVLVGASVVIFAGFLSWLSKHT